MPFAMSRRAEAERWLRILRLYGEAGQALQALAVPEGPLETSPTELPTDPREVRRERADQAVQHVADHAVRLATLRGAPMLGTLDILFAVLAVYGSDFDRALYVRGSSREELLGALAESYRHARP
jgi:hypothetical protein